MALVTDFIPNKVSFGVRVSDLFKGWVEGAQKRKIYRTTFAELNALSDRELADLGISRSAIKGVAWDSAYGA